MRRLVRWAYGAQLLTGIVAVLIGLCVPGPAQGAGENPPVRAPLGRAWEASITPGDEASYGSAVERLLMAYESQVGEKLSPGPRGKVGLKVNSRAGPGLSTPKELLRATIKAMEKRGFSRESILIVDHSERELRQAGILPRLSAGNPDFEGCPILALDSGQYYDADWFYDSPLPSSRHHGFDPFSRPGGWDDIGEDATDRKSFLPMPLLFDVDFWINLPVGIDDPALGVDGVLANATLWNVGNSRRFLANGETAATAVAEIAAIPELQERMVLHLLPLELYQFIGGPEFNAHYTRSEPRLWLSGDPVALDRLLYDRMNAARRQEGFSEIDPLPSQIPFAASLDLGYFKRSQIEIKRVDE
ncbi:MAG: DUF362 domain-containing protein [Opitutales bacterium]